MTSTIRGTDNFDSSIKTPGKNKMINGDFDIWQRGTSQTISGYGSDDRWNNFNIGSTKTHSRQIFTLGQAEVPGNPTYYCRTVVNSVANSANICGMLQRIEGVKTFAGQTCTLSFWAKADSTKDIAIEYKQSFGTSGSPSADVSAIGVQKFSLTSTWQKFTYTTNIPSIVGKTLGSDGNNRLELLFWFDAGSDYNSRTDSLGQQSGTFDIAQVQLEEGLIATPFEQRLPGVDLALCQRYYSRGTTTVLMNYWYTHFIQTMRDAPNMVVTPANFQLSTISGFRVSAASYPIDFYWYADAEL